jgi:hypothetical protein
MRVVWTVLAVGAIAIVLGGCETARESSLSAADTCRSSGLRPGTKAYSNCYHRNYAMNREDARSADNAVAAGVVGGLVGGAIAASGSPYYGYGYYGRGCWRCY